MKFDFNDILLVPETISSINSRKEVNPYDENGMLPIMTAPMDTVIDMKNFKTFVDNKIYSILPRGISGATGSINKFVWQSYGLEEFEEVFTTKKIDPIEHEDEKYYALIDTANGHMQKLFSLAKKAKEMYGDKLVLMVGNIANPNTFVEYAKIGVDYVRCGIGGGQACWVDGTKVLTNNGYKNIEDIQINELVLTHTGEYKEVINKISYKNSEYLYNVNGEICTKNHELYVVFAKDINQVNEKNYKKYAFFLSVAEVTDEHLILSWDEE